MTDQIRSNIQKFGRQSCRNFKPGNFVYRAVRFGLRVEAFARIPD